VILRRLLDHGRISQATYEAKTSEWDEDYFRGGPQGTGGSYYANQGTYLSEGFVNLAYFQYHAGRIGVGDLADYLGIKARNLGRFEEFILSSA
jgi:hypothetical protein